MVSYVGLVQTLCTSNNDRHRLFQLDYSPVAPKNLPHRALFELDYIPVFLDNCKSGIKMWSIIWSITYDIKITRQPQTYLASNPSRTVLRYRIHTSTFFVATSAGSRPLAAPPLSYNRAFIHFRASSFPLPNQIQSIHPSHLQSWGSTSVLPVPSRRRRQLAQLRTCEHHVHGTVDCKPFYDLLAIIGN